MPWKLCGTRNGAVVWAVLAAGAMQARGAITAVTASADAVGTYAKLELTVNVTGKYVNPYDPEEVDMSAEFVSPSKKVWKVNGFYDGARWKVRFAANEPGEWRYVVKVFDLGGNAQSQEQHFTCTASKNHGWVKVAPNNRYLAYDDGTSFYGVGACHAWSVTTNTLDQMKALGFNTYVYWNGTYDNGGGNALLESWDSGLGYYDQRKCTRLDTLLEWTEARDMTMVLVILPHDYACENIPGWPAKWQLNPYSSIVSSAEYYSDPDSWAYQQNQYRYMIARWGYSRALLSWQTVDEISGTSGWRANQATANEWTAKMAAFFHAHDPFKHPTTASHGDYWEEGNKVNDLPNTEVYGNYQTYNIVATIQRLWNNYEKPCIMGETGTERDGESAHRRLWSGLASGIAVTPLLWQFNQGWNAGTAAQYPAFNKFIAEIDFAGLKHLAQAKVTIPGTVVPAAPPGRGRGARGGAGAAAGARGGPAASTELATTSAPATATAPAIPVAGVWGITSDQMTFGWMTGEFSGRALRMTGLANGTYQVEWWSCTDGTISSTSSLIVRDGSFTTSIPTTTQPDIAFKIIAPKGTPSG